MFRILLKTASETLAKQNFAAPGPAAAQWANQRASTQHEGQAVALVASWQNKVFLRHYFHAEPGTHDYVTPLALAELETIFVNAMGGVINPAPHASISPMAAFRRAYKDKYGKALPVKVLVSIFKKCVRTIERWTSGKSAMDDLALQKLGALWVEYGLKKTPCPSSLRPEANIGIGNINGNDEGEATSESDCFIFWG